MKKIFMFLLFILLSLPTILHAGAVEYTKLDVPNWRGTHYLNGDFIMFQSTPTAASNFEIIKGSITKCSSITSTLITATTINASSMTITAARLTGPLTISSQAVFQDGTTQNTGYIINASSTASIGAYNFPVGSWSDINSIYLPEAGTYFVWGRLRYFAATVGGFGDFAGIRLWNVQNNAVATTVTGQSCVEALAENQNQSSTLTLPSFWVISSTQATSIKLQGTSSANNQHFLASDVNGSSEFGSIRLK